MHTNALIYSGTKNNLSDKFTKIFQISFEYYTKANRDLFSLNFKIKMIYVFEDGYTSNACCFAKCCVDIRPHASAKIVRFGKNGKLRQSSQCISHLLSLFPTTTLYAEHSYISIACSNYWARMSQQREHSVGFIKIRF